MKKTLLFSGALLAAMAASAQTWQASTVAEGDFYLYNVGAGQYLQGGNSWGTQISLHQGGQLVSLVANGDAYNIDSHISNGGDNHFLGGGEYLDGAASPYTFEDLGNGAYAIKAANGNYMFSDGSTLIKHSATADLTSPNAQWKLVTADALKADMANASLANPVDVTPLIYCAGFGRNNTYKTAWSGEPAIGGANDNMCAEKWSCLFDVFQTLEGMPAGNYKLMVQGFYRPGNGGDMSETQNAILYVNDNEQGLRTLGSEAGNCVAGNDFGGVILPNSMDQASKNFSAGLYENTMSFKLAEDGKITFGVKKEVEVGNDWTIFDNFRLIYTGVPNFDAITALVDQAKQLTAPHDAELDTEFGTAISYAEQVVTDKDEANMEKAINELQAAIDKMNASIKEYADVKVAIEAADATAAAFDADGQAAYNKIIKWAKADYDDGALNFNEESGNGIYTTIHEALMSGATAQTTKGADLTAAIANPDFETGTLSGWDVVNVQWQNNNTYNGEGASINRFAEKWVPGGNNLGNCSLTQTVTLGKGVYVLEADVIATQQGGMPEDGIVGMNLVAGSNSVACSTENGQPKHIALEFEAPYTQNTMDLGFTVEETNGNWFAVDNFKLTLKYRVMSEPELAEMYFETYDAIFDGDGICTYEKDMATNGVNFSQMVNVTSEGMPTDWTIVENGDARAAGIFAYGSTAFLGSKGYLPPAQGSVEGSNQALGLNPVWGAALQYTRPYGLKNGYYKATTAIYNAAGASDAGGTAVAANKIGYICGDGTEHFFTTTNFPKGEWTNDEVMFEVTEDYSEGKLSAGVSSPGQGTAGNVHLFVDYILIDPITAAEYYAEALPAAIAEAKTVAANIGANEGEDLFMYAPGSADALNAAIAAAEALTDESTAEEFKAAMSALEAASKPAQTLPEAGVYYVFKNSAADVYMNIAEEVKLQEKGTAMTFVAVEGGYQLQSGDKFVGMAGTNNWSMNNAAATTWNFAPIGEGKYTIQGPKGMIGADATAAGSACYGNKNADTNGKWEITKASVNMEYEYAEGNTTVTFKAQPNFDCANVFVFFDGDDEPAGMMENGSFLVAPAPGQFNEQGIAHFLVEVRAYSDDFSTILASDGVEVDLTNPVPEPTISFSYSSDNSSCVVKAEGTQEGTSLVISIDGGEEFTELPAEGYTVAWLESLADEQGICIYNIVVREVSYDENYVPTIVSEAADQVHVNHPFDPVYGMTEYDLKKEYFCQWDAYTAGANVVIRGIGEPAWGVSTGLPYGDGNVAGCNYADLTQWDVLVLTVTEGTPRMLFNRQGMDNSGDYIEINSADSPYVISSADGIWYIDLQAIREAAGFAHLNCIKGANWQNTTITQAQLFGEEGIEYIGALKLEVATAYSEDNSSCVITSTPTQSETMMVVSIDGGEEFMELPAEGYTVAWLESLADASGICVYNVVVREVKMTENEDGTFNTEVICEGFEQVHLSKPIVNLELTFAYSEDNSSCVVTSEPTESETMMVISIDGGNEFTELPAEGYTVAWLEALADEQGICVYNIVVREVKMTEDEEGNFTTEIICEGFDQVHLSKPIVTLEVKGAYSADYSSCVITSEPTESETMMVISIDGGQEFTELPAEGYTVAWLEALADETGTCIYNVVVREVKMTEDEEGNFTTEIICEGFEQFSLVKPFDPVAGMTEYALEQEYFCQWDAYTAGANVVLKGIGAADWGVSTGLPYGDGNVAGCNYADLTQWDVLALTVTEGAPRLLLNRQGMDNSGNYIEINSADSPYVISATDGVWYIDLQAIREEAGFAHLNCIKGANWQNTTITNAQLFGEEDIIYVGVNSAKATAGEEVIYDLAGRRVTKAVKGNVYIINGKTVLK